MSRKFYQLVQNCHGKGVLMNRSKRTYIRCFFILIITLNFLFTYAQGADSSLHNIFSFNPTFDSNGKFRDAIIDTTKRKVPVMFEFHFPEFDNKTLYDKALEIITYYQNYKNSPFKIDNSTYYNPSLYFKITDSLLKNRSLNIHALHYYVDLKTAERKEDIIHINTRLPYEYIYQPFWLLNAEVTNEEYREFVYYVRDSIARTLLAYGANSRASDFYERSKNDQLILKWNKAVPYDSGDDDVRADLQPMYLPDGERFYNRREIDTRKINYKFWLIPDYEEDVVNVYPDTLVWVHDGFEAEALANMYFWHPGYDKYPVVGLSAKQIHAFLFWKTQKLQRELDKKNIPLIVEFALPNEVELEMIEVIKKAESKFDKYRLRNKIRIEYTNAAFKYNLDLFLTGESKTHYETNKKLKSKAIANFLVDKYKTAEYTSGYPTTISTIEQKKDPIRKAYYIKAVSYGIPFLNCNVSEIMHENLCSDDSTQFVNTNKKWSNNLCNYSTTFPVKGNLEESYMIYKRFEADSKPFNELKFLFMDSTKVQNDLCKLVRGANWFDKAEWSTGHLKKTFVSVDSSYATLGFRYVVRFKPKYFKPK
jgi:hypothetical protein